MMDLQKLYNQYCCEEIFAEDDSTDDDCAYWKKVFYPPLERTPKIKCEDELVQIEINLVTRDVEMTVRDIVENQGLCFEEHKVTTEDGYILTIHRVATDFEQSRPPAFL